ncbi:formylglycine-generating enzyme family protein [bacterium]|nr:formylglycine-generating enzyme family protein [bacterium]
MIRFISIFIILMPFFACESKNYLDKINNNLVSGDKTNMILIPEGEAIIGSNFWFEKGHPERKVYLKSYYIDKYEVSNRDYNTCVSKGVCKISGYYGLAGFNEPEKPVVGVSFDDAEGYCKWLGKRLPNEEEWEKAARGTDGRLYPWGDEEIDCSKAVYGNGWSYECEKVHQPHPTYVNSFEESVSPYGLFHVSGNVWEWTTTDYEPEYFIKPKTAKVKYKTIKGGSFGSSKKYQYTFSRRWERKYQRTIGTGFRCVMDLK